MKPAETFGCEQMQLRQWVKQSEGNSRFSFLN